jgi:hypothetical protein
MDFCVLTEEAEFGFMKDGVSVAQRSVAGAPAIMDARVSGGLARRCRMGTVTRSFGNICFFCIVAGVAAAGLITLGVVAWVSLL